jgi:Protein of unknown function (DUF559)
VGRESQYLRLPSQTIDATIAAAAAKQQGNLTRQQLLDIGLDKHGIAYRVKVGRLYRVHRTIYSVGRRAVTPRERASAAVLACGASAALSHASAMTLWGFWKRWEQPFEVTVPGDRRPPGIKVHRSSTINWRDVTTQLGIRVTSPARTIFDTAPRMTDKTLRRTVNQALHTLWLHESHLAELIGRLGHLPQAKRIAPLIGLPGTPPRSGWEDDFPAFCAEHGLPTPVMGALVCGYVVDALFPEQKLIVELDSIEFHHNAIAFEADRERDAETLAHGFGTVRITWERRQQTPGREAERLRTILQAPRAA